MTGRTITVQYDCKGCRTKDRGVSVRERLPSEDLMDWLTTVQRELGVDHMKISPWCSSRLCDIKIPIAAGENVRVGEAQRQ